MCVWTKKRGSMNAVALMATPDGEEVSRVIDVIDDDDDVYYYIRWRLKLEGETENMCVCTKERKGVAAAVLMATPCTNSLGGESGGQKHEGCEGQKVDTILDFCVS